MLSIKKFNNVYWKSFALIAFACFLYFVAPHMGLAAETTASVQTKIKKGTTGFQTVLTGIAVAVGIVASLKIVIKHLPGIDDPHTKNEMWKSIGNVILAVAAAAALIWIVPWVYALFK
ncbi:hypothetical protein B4102_2201 [Heyndrickxia sporothermodurans]|uniref:Conjugal transfer protein n=1 Tax=Heyndrickxia sporothermodurans TaxID=46224 RepID=A0A150LGG2_9BACI|nr:CagC family type IV secretion system protein [Heyndrickxia sporothermodurans]KYD11473.1 hypothetical protein B4102_2201 [Heyndrickxia sporothermodurans]